MNTFITIYAIIGILVAGYIVLSHLCATWKYIKQLYTAKYVEPSEIKTFFGFKYWPFNDNDFWAEVIGMSTLFASVFIISSLLLWPICIIFFLNVSITKARKRIENGD